MFTSWTPRRWQLACGVLTALVSVPWVLLHGTMFDAEATLEYRPTTVAELSWQELLATERAILRSRSVCERAAARLGQRPREVTDGGRTGGVVCDDIQVERVGPERVLRIQLAHPDAGLAARFVDGVAQAYLERHAEQTLAANPSLAAAVSELDAQGQELDLLEQEAESYARERGLLTYDAELERSELGLLRQELARVRIREIALVAELKQLEPAVEARTYDAHRLTGDPGFREQKARLAKIALDDVQVADGGVGGPRATLAAELHAQAVAVVSGVKAELELLRDQQRELGEFLAMQDDKLVQREQDLRELRKRRRSVAEHQAMRDVLLQGPAAAASGRPTFAVRLLDRGHVVGRSLSASAWLGAGLLLLASFGLAWGAWRVRA